MNETVKNLLLCLVAIVVAISAIQNLTSRQTTQSKWLYSEFLSQLDQGAIQSVSIEDGRFLRGLTKTGQSFNTYMPIHDQYLLQDLIKKGVKVEGVKPQQESFFLRVFVNWFPMLLLIGVWIFFMRQMQGGGGRGAMAFGKSKARLQEESKLKVTFSDVAGVDEAKDEVKELVDFLKDPQKFQKLGGQIPRGVLLVGPPGTGKTLLAKAVAGEAGVPFFIMSGSEFVEMFVGVGASRVRHVFEEGKKKAPCIIFIDEIDAVGRHRGAGLGGGHDEREQTLNQLLVEMDGFEGKEGVIIFAATNRPDVLDPALLRPGRFDRQVVVPLPDIRGREAILAVHIKKIPCDPDVDVAVIARGTPGFSGADLANLVNEAALFAARFGKQTVDMAQFEKAKDKLIMGAERRSLFQSEQDKWNTAYHEAGHAVVGLTLRALGFDHDPVYKVSIIPRGMALGVTVFLPEEDRYGYSKKRLEAQLSSLFGGRIAEGLVFGLDAVTTGASNDIQRATHIARNMVIHWGLSEKLGPLCYAEEEGEVFLGRSISRQKAISDETAHQIDLEVRSIIDRNYERALNILKENRNKLDLMAKALMQYETIELGQINDVMDGRVPEPPKGWHLPSEAV